MISYFIGVLIALALEGLIIWQRSKEDDGVSLAAVAVMTVLAFTSWTFIKLLGMLILLILVAVAILLLWTVIGGRTNWGKKKLLLREKRFIVTDDEADIPGFRELIDTIENEFDNIDH